MNRSAYYPWFESIALGTRTVPRLPQLKRAIYYSSPQDDTILVWGLQAVFQNRATKNITIQLAESNQADVWTPFYQVPNYAAVGTGTGAWPVLPLPSPYVLQPGRRIQILLYRNQNAIDPNEVEQITLVGVRDLTRGEGH
jgi:hypothetical protein